MLADDLPALLDGHRRLAELRLVSLQASKCVQYRVDAGEHVRRGAAQAREAQRSEIPLELTDVVLPQG